MDSFSELKNKYKQHGAKIFRKEIDECVESLLMQATINENLGYLFSDICMDLAKFDLSLKILFALENAYGLTDVGYNNIGYCWWEKNEYKQALAAFEKSLSINPRNLSSVRGASYCGIEVADKAKAVSLNRLYYFLSNGSLESSQWFATSLFNDGNDEDLINLLKSAMSKFPGDQLLADLWEECEKLK